MTDTLEDLLKSINLGLRFVKAQADAADMNAVLDKAISSAELALRQTAASLAKIGQKALKCGGPGGTPGPCPGPRKPTTGGRKPRGKKPPRAPKPTQEMKPERNEGHGVTQTKKGLHLKRPKNHKEAIAQLNHLTDNLNSLRKKMEQGYRDQNMSVAERKSRVKQVKLHVKALKASVEMSKKVRRDAGTLADVVGGKKPKANEAAGSTADESSPKVRKAELNRAKKEGFKPTSKDAWINEQQGMEFLKAKDAARDAKLPSKSSSDKGGQGKAKAAVLKKHPLEKARVNTKSPAVKKAIAGLKKENIPEIIQNTNILARALRAAKSIPMKEMWQDFKSSAKLTYKVHKAGYPKEAETAHLRSSALAMKAIFTIESAALRLIREAKGDY